MRKVFADMAWDQSQRLSVTTLYAAVFHVLKNHLKIVLSVRDIQSYMYFNVPVAASRSSKRSSVSEKKKIIPIAQTQCKPPKASRCLLQSAVLHDV